MLPRMSVLEMENKPAGAVGCNGDCLRNKSLYRTFVEPDHAYCTKCGIHMNLPKKKNAKKDLCPCCGFQVRRRPIDGGKAFPEKRIGSKMAKVLLICGHSHNTFQLDIVTKWQNGQEHHQAVHFYCEESKCRRARQIVWAWLVTI